MDEGLYMIIDDGNVLSVSFYISPRVRDITWHQTGWQLNLSIGLNRSLKINLYVDMDKYLKLTNKLLFGL